MTDGSYGCSCYLLVESMTTSMWHVFFVAYTTVVTHFYCMSLHKACTSHVWDVK